MEVIFIEQKGTWRDVADAARTTVGMEPGTKEPSEKWKRAILKAEHSPIRLLRYRFRVEGVPYWVAMHFTRHKIGIEHFIRSQRTDRTGVNRDELPQNAQVTWEFEANAQAMINISRKRLCYQAAKETRRTWECVINKLPDMVLWDVLSPECVYRGFCPEMNPCGFAETEDFKTLLKEYRQ